MKKISHQKGIALLLLLVAVAIIAFLAFARGGRIFLPSHPSGAERTDTLQRAEDVKMNIEKRTETENELLAE